MIDDVDLFDDNAPPLKRCDGCGNYFEELELKKCRVCGKYFCPTCRKTHDCRIKPDAAGAAQTPAPTPVSRPAAVPAAAPVAPQPVRREPVNEPVTASVPLTGEFPESKEIPLDSDERTCDSCGNVFPKSELRQCQKCGAILCPDCRKHHKCKKPKKAEEIPAIPDDDGIGEEPNLANDGKKKKRAILGRKQKKSSAESGDYYESIMNYDEKKGAGKKKQIIIFSIIGVVVLAAIVFVLLNLFGVLHIIPFGGAAGGGIAGIIGGGSIVGDWDGVYNGAAGTIMCEGNNAGFISGSGFLGIPGKVSALTWTKDDSGNFKIAAPMSDISPSIPVVVNGNTMTITMYNGQQVTLTRA